MPSGHDASIQLANKNNEVMVIWSLVLRSWNCVFYSIKSHGFAASFNCSTFYRSPLATLGHHAHLLLRLMSLMMTTMISSSLQMRMRTMMKMSGALMRLSQGPYSTCYRCAPWWGWGELWWGLAIAHILPATLSLAWLACFKLPCLHSSLLNIIPLSTYVLSSLALCLCFILTGSDNTFVHWALHPCFSTLAFLFIGDEFWHFPTLIHHTCTTKSRI